jgi:hypothetical protein
VIHANLHNFLFVIGFVLVGALLFGLLARTALARVPILGQVIQLGAKQAA